MNAAGFKSSVMAPAPPPDLPPALEALWWAGKGDWDKAHTIVMREQGCEAAWVHAYLHRVEGDLANARYWYGTAGRPAASGPHDVEWAVIVAALLPGMTARPR